MRGSTTFLKTASSTSTSDKRSGGCQRMERFLEKTVGKLGMYQTIRPLVVGLVHGLAGSAAVALLVLSTIKEPFLVDCLPAGFWFRHNGGNDADDRSHLTSYGLHAKKFFNINRHLTAISGLASVAFGIFLVYQIGFVDGLFKSKCTGSRNR
jgi:hypothetical protein